MRLHLFFILLLILPFCSIAQNFEFLYKIDPSLGGLYNIKITRQKSKQIITVQEFDSKKFVQKNLSEKEFEPLITFFENYDFPTKKNYTSKTIREYQNTVALPDTNWILLYGDSVRFETMRLKGFYYDTIVSKFYSETQAINQWTDGCHYKGTIHSGEMKKSFYYHDSQMRTQDEHLNKIILGLIRKYDTKKAFQPLQNLLNLDQPKQKLKNDWQNQSKKTN